MRTPLVFTLIVLFVIMPFQVAARDTMGTVVVSVDYMGSIVEGLTGDSWRVASIIPAGVDPHEYHLTEKDISLLQEADVIVVSNHTHFEQKIIELVGKGELRNKTLIVIEDIKGITLLINPATRAPNLHLVLYHPNNLLAFLEEVTKALTSIDYVNRDKYEAKLTEISGTVKGLMEKSGGKLKGKAVGSSPLVQYAVAWLGVEIIDLLEPEHEAPVSPQDLINIEQKIRDGYYDYVVIMGVFSEGGWRPSTKYDEHLFKLAKKWNANIIVVPDPIQGSSNIIQNLYRLSSEPYPGEPQSGHQYLLPTVALAIILALTVSYIILKRR